MKIKLIHPAHINGVFYNIGDEPDVDEDTFKYLQYAHAEIRNAAVAKEAQASKVLDVLKGAKQMPEVNIIPGMGAARPHERNLDEKVALASQAKARGDK